jgi:hypothetical protein
MKLMVVSVQQMLVRTSFYFVLQRVLCLMLRISLCLLVCLPDLLCVRVCVFVWIACMRSVLDGENHSLCLLLLFTRPVVCVYIYIYLCG